MSISSVRNFFEKSGCATVVSIVIAIVFIIGIFAIGGGGRNQPEPTGATADQTPLATLGSYPITIGRITNAVAEGRSQRVQQGMEPSSVADAQITAQELYREVQQGLLLKLAQDRGIRITDQMILQELEKSIEGQVQQARFQMILNGQLKPDASEKDFQDAFRKQMGTDVAGLKTRQTEAVKAALQDPAQRPAYEAAAVQSALVADFTKTIKPTDEEVKKSLGTLEVQKIVLTDQPGGKSASERAQEVVKEIRAGLGFETAINRYSTATLQPGKKKTDTEPLSMSKVMSDPQYASLKSGTVGTISDPIQTFEGWTIYRIAKAKTDLPKDFEKNKATHRDSLVQTLANAQVLSAIEELQEKSPIKWASPGYGLLYEWIALQMDRDKPGKAELAKAHQDIAERAKKAVDEDDPLGGQMMARLARYLALDSIWQTLSPAERDQRRAERIDAIRSAMEAGESSDLQLELVDLLAEEKSKEAADVLIRVAENNYDLDELGQSISARINGMVTKLQASGLLTSEQLKTIAREQERWRKERDERLKQEAEDRKLAEQAEKAAKAEADKAKAAEKAKPPVKPVERNQQGAGK